MEPAPVTSYVKEFLRSPHHAWLATLLLGGTLATGMVLPLIVGGTAYALAWLYLPDSGFFKAWVNRRREQERQAGEQGQVAEFLRRRQAMLAGLDGARQARYNSLAAVCDSIEQASRQSAGTAPGEPPDPRLRKLDELMWTCLRMLSMEQSLDQYLALEHREDPLRQRDDAAAVVSQERERLAAAQAAKDDTVETKQKLLASKEELLSVLQRRCERVRQAQDNLDLVSTELLRLEQQIKLVRADAVAVRNTDLLTSQIDATVGHLEQTNRLLSEMDGFTDMAAGLPLTDLRVGYQSASGPGDGNDSPGSSPRPPPPGGTKVTRTQPLPVASPVPPPLAMRRPSASTTSSDPPPPPPPPPTLRSGHG